MQAEHPENGEAKQQVDTPPRRPLLDALRELVEVSGEQAQADGLQDDHHDQYATTVEQVWQRQRLRHRQLGFDEGLHRRQFAGQGSDHRPGNLDQFRRHVLGCLRERLDVLRQLLDDLR